MGSIIKHHDPKASSSHLQQGSTITIIKGSSNHHQSIHLHHLGSTITRFLTGQYQLSKAP
jgi:hypothetical protein